MTQVITITWHFSNNCDVTTVTTTRLGSQLKIKSPSLNRVPFSRGLIRQEWIAQTLHSYVKLTISCSTLRHVSEQQRHAQVALNNCGWVASKENRTKAWWVAMILVFILLTFCIWIGASFPEPIWGHFSLYPSLGYPFRQLPTVSSKHLLVEVQQRFLYQWSSLTTMRICHSPGAVVAGEVNLRYKDYSAYRRCPRCPTLQKDWQSTGAEVGSLKQSDPNFTFRESTPQRKPIISHIRFHVAPHPGDSHPTPGNVARSR